MTGAVGNDVTHLSKAITGTEIEGLHDIALVVCEARVDAEPAFGDEGGGFVEVLFGAADGDGGDADACAFGETVLRELID